MIQVWHKTTQKMKEEVERLLFLPHLNPCLLKDGSDPCWYLEVVSLGGLGWGKGEVPVLLGLGRGRRRTEVDDGRAISELNSNTVLVPMWPSTH